MTVLVLGLGYLSTLDQQRLEALAVELAAITGTSASYALHSLSMAITSIGQEEERASETRHTIQELQRATMPIPIAPFPYYPSFDMERRQARGFPSYEAPVTPAERQLQRLRYRAPPAPPPSARPAIVRRNLP